MGNSPLDKISEKHREEFAKLKGGRRRMTTLVIGVGILLFILSLTISNVPSGVKGREDLERARHQMLARNGSWPKQLSADQHGYALWLKGHGLEIERRLYTQSSTIVFSSVNHFAGDGTFFSNLIVSLHAGALRVLFVLIACWRIWIVGALLAAVICVRRWKVYAGRDILGQMGTGQFFYSGLKADLSKVSSSGAPERQVTGLACPQLSSETEGDFSSLGRLLKRRGVANPTNRMLVRVLRAYQEWPAYVAEIDGESAFNRYFAGASLLEHTAEVLERLLALHHEYLEGRDDQPHVEQQFAGSDVAEDKVSSAEYAWLLQHSCHRVLTAEMRQCLRDVSPMMLTTLVLAHFSGKVMAYDFQGGKWIRRSNFPELCSRAVLHSIAELSDDYVFEERAIIRRALIYGSRKNIFAPVRFPTDLNPETRALRAWVELLLALPHELQSVGDEVEFIGLLHQMHQGWNNGFFDTTQGLSKELDLGTFATQSNLFLVPVQNLVMLARRSIDPELLKRAEELASLVSQKQRIEGIAAESASADSQTEKGALYHQGRVFPPLSHSEVRSLAGIHHLDEVVVKEWSAIRAMLNHYGWLARRVGDYSVSDHTIIFGIVRSDGTLPGANALGLVGRPGMIALRGSRLSQRWGKQWQSRFVFALSATMAENQIDFDNLMQGVEDRLVDDIEIATIPIIGNQ